MVDSTPLLPGLSPIEGRAVVARFDGGRLSSNGGLLLVREVERRLGVADRLAGCLVDRRDPDRVSHPLAEIIRFRALAIVAGYEDGNDCDRLRHDPMFKLALDRLPESGDPLCSQPTVSRLENAVSRSALYRLGQALIDQYCASYRQPPSRIVLDIDDTFDEAHGAQQLAFFNGHYDGYGFQPFVLFDDTGRMVTAVLRPAKTPGGREILTLLKRVVARIRKHWPEVAILLRGDSHYGRVEVMDWCDATGLTFVFGLQGHDTIHAQAGSLKADTAAAYAARPASAAPAKLRRFAEFEGGYKRWPRRRRIIARAEAGPSGTDIRYVVTNLVGGKTRQIYERTYCRRGQMENFIKAYKAHLAADRTSCPAATANQFRLFLHAAAYWLVWTLRQAAPKRSVWRTAQVDTIRLHILRLAARVTELRRRIRVQLPADCPEQAIFRVLAICIPRPAT